MVRVGGICHGYEGVEEVRHGGQKQPRPEKLAVPADNSHVQIHTIPITVSSVLQEMLELVNEPGIWDLNIVHFLADMMYDRVTSRVPTLFAAQ